jgi:hypothetical protein
MKRRRIESSKSQTAPIIERLRQNQEALMLMASALYMGEGAKGEGAFSFANSDPRIIQTWVTLLRRSFKIDELKFRCQLAITDGMNIEGLSRYWSEITGMPLNQFLKPTIKKEGGSRKRDGYKGVCMVYYHSLEVKRWLDAIGQGVIDELLRNTVK